MFPILFKLGSYPVHTYGVMMIIAFLVALVVARKRAPRYGIDPNKLSDMSFMMLIFGILGARILYFVQDPPKDWHEYFSLQFAGLTSFGGLIGGAAVVLWWTRKTKTPMRPLLDVLGPPLLIGWAIGRIGCLMNGCCAGGVCLPGFPFGVHVEDNSLLHYPAQLYDSGMNILSLGIVLFLERKRTFQSGQVFALALGLQGISRFIYEFSRAGTDAQVAQGLRSSTYWGHLPITEAQAVAGVIVIFSIVLYTVYGRRKPMAQEPPSQEAPPQDAPPQEAQPA